MNQLQIYIFDFKFHTKNNFKFWNFKFVNLGTVGTHIDLKAAEGNWWKTAWEKQFNEQNLFNNMAGDALKAVLRIWGWLTLDVLLYHI